MLTTVTKRAMSCLALRTAVLYKNERLSSCLAQAVANDNDDIRRQQRPSPANTTDGEDVSH
jgi:hypothetical protein